MYMIPYFLENEAKKLLKIKLTTIIDNITDKFIENIFYPNSDNKYQDIMLNIDDNVRKSILKVFVETFEIFDNLYLNSKERKNTFNVCIKKCHRSIVTIFGVLEFDRVYYYDKRDRNKHFFFIDTLFHLPSYDRYDDIIKGMAINNAIATNQKKGAELTTNQVNSILSNLNNSQQVIISRQDIYNWIDKWNVPNIEYSPIETDSDTLYIMIDEKYIHEQLKPFLENKLPDDIEDKSTADIKNEILQTIENLRNPNKILMLPAPKEKTKHYIMSKAFITFTDIISNGKRRILNNKTTFLTTSKAPWTEFMDFVAKIYDFKNFKNIKVLSDAGTWITSGIPNLKLFVENVIVPCLCEFHVKQKINRITKDENTRKQLWESIDNDEKDTFNLLIKNILKDKDKKRQDTIKQYKHYIIVHWDAIKEMKLSKYKSSMESHISHNVAKYFSYEPKAYSKRHIQKLIKLQEYRANGINILGLYLKTSNNSEIVTIKKEELSFSIFENLSSNIPTINSSNSHLSKLLKNIAC